MISFVTNVSTREEDLIFDLEYDGPALADHEMDVRDLAPALLSTADLFQVANREVGSSSRNVQVNIRATGQGSFLIQLKLLYDTVSNGIDNPRLTGFEGLAGLLVTVVGAVNYIRKRGRSGEPLVQRIEDGQVRVEWSDGVLLTVPEDSLRLADDSAVRRNLEQIVRPVGRTGVDTLRLTQDDQVLAEVTTEDVPHFAALPESDGEILQSTEREAYLRILNSAWLVGRKWRFSDGRWPFWAQITDQNFNDRLASGERFGALDSLRCRIREVQWRDEHGLHSEITVIEVLEHFEAPEQLKLVQ